MLRFTLKLLLLLQVVTLEAQVIQDSVLIDGRYRLFCFRKPMHPTQGGSLVFAIHGSGGTALDFMKHTTSLNAKAAQDNFMLVFPQGYKKFWNECRKASTAEANRIDIDEEAFFREMIRYFVKNYGLDKKKVFASGISGGGHMTYKLGIRLPELFRGIAVMVANMPATDNMDCTESGKPMATLIINGTADPLNPYDGGEMNTGGLGFTLGKVMSTEASLGYWAGLSGYTGNPVKQILPDPVPDNNITMESYTYKKRGKPEVTLIKVVNGVHGPPKDLDFFEEVWRFCKRQYETK